MAELFDPVDRVAGPPRGPGPVEVVGPQPPVRLPLPRSAAASPNGIRVGGVRDVLRVRPARRTTNSKSSRLRRVNVYFFGWRDRGLAGGVTYTPSGFRAALRPGTAEREFQAAAERPLTLAA